MPRAASRDAIALLKADHRKIEALFTSFESTPAAPRRRFLAGQICEALRVHIQIEAEVFYPACEGVVDARLLREARLEHEGAKVLIAEIETGDPADRFYDAKVRVLCEMIENHIEEVEGALFGQMRRAGLDLQTLGERMATEKARLLAAMGRPLAAGAPTIKATAVR